MRVRVRLGSIRLTFEGDQSFYEAHVESLLAAASLRPPPAPASSRSGPASAVPVAASAPPAPAPATPPPAAARPAWTPQSGDFGRYIRRLGSEAAEPDRQVVAFAFYLWNYERRETFGRAELAACFQTLHLPVPEPLDPILDDLTERKRFLERAGDGTWRLSKKGENYVKTRLLTS